KPLDIRYGKLLSHERFLDFRGGILQRKAEWQSPAGARVLVSSTRLVSLTQRSIAAVSYEVEPLDAPTRLVIQSELVANEPATSDQSDPRAAALLEAPLVSEQFSHHDGKVVLSHRTRVSGLRMAAAMDHVIEAPTDVAVTTESDPDLGRVTLAVELEPGQRLRLVKFIAYGWSSQRAVHSLRDQVEGALASARHSGWEGLLRGQRDYLDRFWDSADVELEGDEQLQQAVRFALFHVLQASARTEDRPIAAKGLT